MVSVIMTAYNREKYIRESIESVLAQSYTNFELIIVDDNSTDSTKDIILSYAHLINVRCCFNTINLGEYLNRNKAAGFAKGDYIKFLDSDDIMSKDCLDVMVSQMKKYPTAGIGLISYFNENLHLTNSKMSPSELYKEYYFKGNLINCGPSSTIIRRDAFFILNGYKNEPYLSDTDFIFRITSKYEAVIFPKYLVYWREHPEQEFNYGILSGAYKRKSYSLFKQYLEEFSNPMHKFETKCALRNLKNRYSRSIILKLLYFKFNDAIDNLKLYQLNIFDLIISLKPNSYPQKN